MKDTERFSRRQLLSLGAAAVLSPALRLYPAASVRLAGRGAWLSALCCLPPLMLYAWLYCRFTAARREGEGLGELTLRALGGKLGRAALLLYGLWLLLYAGFVLRAAAERFVVAIFPDSGPGFFVLTLGLAALLASLGSPRALVRTARMLLPVLLGVIVLLLLFSLRQAELTNLLPLTEEDAVPVLLGALPVGQVLLLGLYAPGFLLGGVEKREGELRARWLWLLGLCLLLSALCAAVLGCFGAEITTRLSLPFFTLVRNLVFFRTLERLEAPVVSLWLIPDFLLASLSLFCAQFCLRLLLGAGPAYRGEALTDMRRGRWLIWLGGAAAIAAGLLMAPNARALALWSERIIPIGQTAAAGLIPVIYMVGKSKQRL